MKNNKFCHLHVKVIHSYLWTTFTGYKYPARLFLGKKYYFANSKSFTSVGFDRQKLSHAIWNYHYPNDVVKKGEIIHHINENRIDDRVDNYLKLSRSEHNIIHNTGKSRTEITRKKISLANLGNKSRLGKPHFINTKNKISIKNRGDGNGMSKLTSKIVLEIRNSYLSGKKLSKKYNISPSQISSIKNKRYWRFL